MSSKGKIFSLIDLFCGAGGFTVGFAQKGFRSVFAVDDDESCIDTYIRNFGGHAVCKDINQVHSFPKADVVIGGPPCQGFSNLGLRLPTDARNQLWRGFLRCVRLVKPLVFVMENVPPLLKSAEFEAIREAGWEFGYEVEGRVLRAANYGVPQKRQRAIVIGSRIGPPQFPKETHYDLNGKHGNQGGVFADQRQPWVTTREAIGDLSLEPDGENWHVGRNPRPESLIRYKCVPPGGNRWDLYRQRPDLTPACWVKKVSGGTDLFGRLEWGKPSLTIRTEFFKPEKGRYLHPEANRPITHREAARFQTFPDEFQFVGSRLQVAKQIGNAVPCLLARHIASTLRKMILSYERQNKKRPRRKAATVRS